MTTSSSGKPPRDLLTLRAVDGRRVQVRARMIKSVQASSTGQGHVLVELYKKGRSYVVLADADELGAQVAALRPKSRTAKPTDPPGVFEYSLRYYTPYKEPPDGMARVQLTVRVEVPPGKGSPGAPPEIMARWHELGGPGCGWSICSQFIEPPVKVRSQEHRARQRTQNLERRATKKAPLFAEQIIHRELTRRPGYFAGETLTRAPAQSPDRVED
ncbi:hypothetical protein [Deinococcus aestuarii]|uniref:hypothetical protein n=1 Tax=Deinococcus aestuarii TaxID=2774531 RepID=UPI001C0BE09E|nr:hypothetical protein [Deinococcus aestuarii]